MDYLKGISNELEIPMKQKLNNLLLLTIALVIILATLLHGSIADISIFHGMILHPIFLLVGLYLCALAIDTHANQKKSSQGKLL